MKTIATAFIPLFALGLVTPAIAQENPAAPATRAAPASAKAGDTVYDKTGEVVGTVESIAGQNAVISTTTGKAPVRVAFITTANDSTAAMIEAAAAARSQYLKVSGFREGNADSILFQIWGLGSRSGRVFSRDNAEATASTSVFSGKLPGDCSLRRSRRSSRCIYGL